VPRSSRGDVHRRPGLNRSCLFLLLPAEGKLLWHSSNHRRATYALAPVSRVPSCVRDLVRAVVPPSRINAPPEQVRPPVEATPRPGGRAHGPLQPGGLSRPPIALLNQWWAFLVRHGLHLLGDQRHAGHLAQRLDQEQRLDHHQEQRTTRNSRSTWGNTRNSRIYSKPRQEVSQRVPLGR